MKNGFIFSGIVLVLLLFVFQLGRCRKEKEIDEVNNNSLVNNNVESAVIRGKQATDNFNATKFILQKSNDSLIELLNVAQTKERRANEKINETNKKYKLLSDSVKNYFIDTLQTIDNTGLLMRYNNYPILENKYINCEEEKNYLNEIIENDSTILYKCELSEYAKDTAIIELQSAMEYYQKSANKKNTRNKIKNFLLYITTGIATTSTAILYFVAPKSK